VGLSHYFFVPLFDIDDEWVYDDWYRIVAWRWLMEVGTWKTVSRAFFLFLDEVGHFIGLDGFAVYHRFCIWAHREDGS